MFESKYLSVMTWERKNMISTKKQGSITGPRNHVRNLRKYRMSPKFFRSLY